MRVLSTIAFLALSSVPPSAARADGLIYRLPKDGTSVKFELKGSFDRNGRTVAYDGTFSMSSVGKETVDGNACRWIEFQIIAELEGKARVDLFRLLVPENQLASGKSPVSHVKKMWSKQGDRLAREHTDLSDPKAGLLPGFLAGPFEDAKKLEVKTIDSGLGNLECKGVTGSTKYRQGAKDSEITFTNRLNGKAPFGVVTSEMKILETRDGRQSGKGTLTLKAVEIGKDAVTAISKAEISHADLETMGARITKVGDRIISISFDGDKVTDAGLVHLKGLTNLKSLFLYNTKVTNAGLEHLQGMTSLEMLQLTGTQFTDAGLVHLKGLTGLKTLILYKIHITDAGLVHLQGLTSLKKLDCHGTQVTDAGVEHLKKALPQRNVSMIVRQL